MGIYKNYQETKKYFETETEFIKLMQKRIYRVLIICSNYDFYMLEEDGRIDEQIFNEYVSLNLRYPPVFIHAESSEKAIRILNAGGIDLVISMLSIDDIDAFALAKKIKEVHSFVPIVVLTHFSREVRMRLSKEDMSAVDYVFSWLGDTEILLAIIKLIEDKMNAANDIEVVGVQSILLVEDNIRFYSSYLPSIYKIVLQQSQIFKREGANEHQQMLRKRGRPKIILATNYNDAEKYYERYKNNLLGVITDVRYKRNNEVDPEAGFRFFEHIKNDNTHLPVIIQSSENSNKHKAKEMGALFLSKNSPNLTKQLSQLIKRYFYFGDFIFRTPTGEIVGSAGNLRELQEQMEKIPALSIKFHASTNDFSRWLNARALFSLGSIFRDIDAEKYEACELLRTHLLDEIAKYRLNRGRGLITNYREAYFDKYCIFSRVGEGMMGGKARGLAFIDQLLKKHEFLYKFENVVITIPRSLVLSTDIFDKFMDKNNLYPIALSNNYSDNEILSLFSSATLPEEVIPAILAFLDVNKTPLAVRSSSVLEDSHYQPFAGIYNTYMIPFAESQDKMIEMLCSAVKSVYASTFFKNSKAYMKATKNLIDEEKMGIIIQEVCGTQFEGRFYPTLSGVARSINFYPIEPETPEDGIANIALGLGKQIVEGGKSLRFSPKYPKKILQLSDTDMAIRDTQQNFYAIDSNYEAYTLSADDSINLLKLNINEADTDKSGNMVLSTYDSQNHMLREGSNINGKKVVTFAGVLKYNKFPLAKILEELLIIGAKEMNNPVEIEFAANLNVKQGEPFIFNFLQIRPIVENNETADVDFTGIDKSDILLQSNSALGNGIINDVYDIIYIRPEVFSAINNKKIVPILDKLNSDFVEQNRNYILVGPGRWGSSDSMLGIPIKWPNISQARVIIESGLKDYRVEPSQGTHFFQNLTSFKVGYMTINCHTDNGDYCDLPFLNEQKAEYEDEYLRHVRFKKCMEILINGKNNKAVIKKPVI